MATFKRYNSLTRSTMVLLSLPTLHVFDSAFGIDSPDAYILDENVFTLLSRRF